MSFEPSQWPTTGTATMNTATGQVMGSADANSLEPLLAPVTKKAKKLKSKKASTRIKQYDNEGNLIREKKVKVDEFGNPVKKKKKTVKPNTANFANFEQCSEPSAAAVPSTSNGNSECFDALNGGQGQSFVKQTASAQRKQTPHTPMAAKSQVSHHSPLDTHDLVVQYMISVGANPAAAEELATRFEEQQQRGMETFISDATAPTTILPATSRNNSHDIDKFAMFDDDDDNDGSVASNVIRALEQGINRAKREQNERRHMVSVPPSASPRGPLAAARAHSMPVAPRPAGEGAEDMRILLIQYLISVGTDSHIAEEMADRFEEQQQLSANNTVPMMPPRDLSVPAAFRNEQRHAMQSLHEKNMEAMHGGAARRQQSAPPGRGDAAIVERPVTQSMPSRGRAHFPRADRPGAVEMEGRAFGAPRRAERPWNDQINQEFGELDVETNMGSAYIEAVPVIEKDEDIVYAESANFGIKYILKDRSVRRLFAFVCFLIVGGSVGAIVFALKGSGGDSQVVVTGEPTMSPTSAPSFITADFERAAIAISGFETVLTPESPQRRAVGWLSSVDEFDTEGVGLIFSERYILTVFYYAMKGENWLEQEQWLSPTLHVCDWSIGVTCASDLSRKQVVTGIDLTRNGLSSQIPNEIGLIEGLTLLRLAKNAINGTIPPEISELTNLVNLDLSANQLSGPVPSGIGNLQDLLLLELFDNTLTGTIPSSAYTLGLLKKLDLSNNKLTGTLSQNITNLVSLGSLNIQSNTLNGTIPPFAGLVSLDFIYLDNNQFSGNLPNLGKEMLGRQEFTLSHNRISGSVPGVETVNITDFVGIFFKLQRADISYNQLTGTLPAIMALIPTFKYIDLSGNAFTGSIPAQNDIQGWQSLEFFGGAGNQFNGTIPLGFTTSLSSLDVSYNRLTGGIPLELYSKFPQLEFLALNDNPLGGSISGLLGNFRNARDLHLHNCSLRGSLPDTFQGLTNLDHFSFNDNEIDGTIPSSIGYMSLLTAVYLQNNKLTGSLPPELGMLELLTELNVANNSLTGSLPSSLGMLTKLQKLFVAGNFFLGEVPLGVCENLGEVTTSMVGCDLICGCCSEPNATDVCY